MTIGKPGPFQIIETFGSVDVPVDPPRRRYECPNYSVCLKLAAALNWDSFTCRGCSGEIAQALMWQAHQARKRDPVAGELCEDLPGLGCFEGGDEPAPISGRLQVVGKR